METDTIVSARATNCIILGIEGSLQGGGKLFFSLHNIFFFYQRLRSARKIDVIVPFSILPSRDEGDEVSLRKLQIVKVGIMPLDISNLLA